MPIRWVILLWPCHRYMMHPKSHYPSPTYAYDIYPLLEFLVVDGRIPCTAAVIYFWQVTATPCCKCRLVGWEPTSSGFDNNESNAFHPWESGHAFLDCCINKRNHNWSKIISNTTASPSLICKCIQLMQSLNPHIIEGNTWTLISEYFNLPAPRSNGKKYWCC